MNTKYFPNDVTFEQLLATHYIRQSMRMLHQPVDCRVTRDMYFLNRLAVGHTKGNEPLQRCLEEWKAAAIPPRVFANGGDDHRKKEVGRIFETRPVIKPSFPSLGLHNRTPSGGNGASIPNVKLREDTRNRSA